MVRDIASIMSGGARQSSYSYAAGTNVRRYATSSGRAIWLKSWRSKSIIKTTRFDAAEYLDTPERQAEYISAALETGDAAFIRAAIGMVARARGMSEIARIAGLNRESLYKALSETGNPEFATMLSVLHALGLELSARPAERIQKRRTTRQRTRKAA